MFTGVRTIVVALGGNALLRPDQRGTVEEQRANLVVTGRQLAALADTGCRLVMTHGNGPQVGNLIRQQELAASIIPPFTIALCGAASQGVIGYLIQECLVEASAERRRPLGGFDSPFHSPPVTILTRVVVDPSDPAFHHPTKPVGPLRGEGEAVAGRARGEHWTWDRRGGWRRLVPSPRPLDILEKNVIRLLASLGVTVIAGGGGGIPVTRTPEGSFQEVDAVVDKDLTSALLAELVGADLLLLLTDVPRVALHFGTPNQLDLAVLRPWEAARYAAEGHFGTGSMGPKVEAAAWFAARGKYAVITSLDQAAAALWQGEGTWFVPAEKFSMPPGQSAFPFPGAAAAIWRAPRTFQTSPLETTPAGVYVESDRGICYN
ncbi:MAG: carbamate kinase [Firmicutes bacterium]|nr:carbamate kinase [Bacillota bacterium]